MNIEAINKAFADLIVQKGIEKKLDVERNYVYQLRNRLKNNVAISTDTKLVLLKKTGWREEDLAYSRNDLLSLVNFVLRQGAKAKEFGAEYIIEKWENRK